MSRKRKGCDKLDAHRRGFDRKWVRWEKSEGGKCQKNHKVGRPKNPKKKPKTKFLTGLGEKGEHVENSWAKKRGARRRTVKGGAEISRKKEVRGPKTKGGGASGKKVAGKKKKKTKTQKASGQKSQKIKGGKGDSDGQQAPSREGSVFVLGTGAKGLIIGQKTR